MTLAEKIVILDTLLGELSVTYHVSGPTIHTIQSSEDKIHTSVKTSVPVSPKVSQVPRRNPLIEKM